MDLFLRMKIDNKLVCDTGLETWVGVTSIGSEPIVTVEGLRWSNRYPEGIDRDTTCATIHYVASRAKEAPRLDHTEG